MERVNCLVCDKELEYEVNIFNNGNVYDGGFMLVSFHYGSKHDQNHGLESRKAQRGLLIRKMDKLLACDEIEAFICDECFEKKYMKMKGYDIKKVRERVKVDF